MTLTAAAALPLQKEKTDRKKREPNMGFGKYFKPFKPNNADSKPAPATTATQPLARDIRKPEVQGKTKKRMTLGQRIAAKD